jgi:serine/threonine protein phosphatase PrpC
VEDEEIARVIGQNTEPQKAADVLVDMALDRGAPDNVTAVIAQYEFERDTVVRAPVSESR